jgi:hypothetical protein
VRAGPTASPPSTHTHTPLQRPAAAGPLPDGRHGSAPRVGPGAVAAAHARPPARRLLQADLECINAMFTDASANELLAGKPDFVLDAIDNINTKVGLRKPRLRRACLMHALPAPPPLRAPGATAAAAAARLIPPHAHTSPPPLAGGAAGALPAAGHPCTQRCRRGGQERPHAAALRGHIGEQRGPAGAQRAQEVGLSAAPRVCPLAKPPPPSGPGS